jgi:hypothetical protein
MSREVRMGLGSIGDRKPGGGCSKAAAIFTIGCVGILAAIGVWAGMVAIGVLVVKGMGGI